MSDYIQVDTTRLVQSNSWIGFYFIESENWREFDIKYIRGTRQVRQVSRLINKIVINY